MSDLNLYLNIANTFLGLVNISILFYLAIFIVRLRGFLEDFLRLYIENSDMDLAVPNNKSKTWDEKYEEELSYIQNKMKSQNNSGLVDIQ